MDEKLQARSIQARCVGDGDNNDDGDVDVIRSQQDDIKSIAIMSIDDENPKQKELISNKIVANHCSNLDHLFRTQMTINTIYKRIQDKLDRLDNKILFSTFLCFISLLFIIMAILSYFSINKVCIFHDTFHQSEN